MTTSKAGGDGFARYEKGGHRFYFGQSLIYDSDRFRNFPGGEKGVEEDINAAFTEKTRGLVEALVLSAIPLESIRLAGTPLSPEVVKGIDDALVAIRKSLEDFR